MKEKLKPKDTREMKFDAEVMGNGVLMIEHGTLDMQNMALVRLMRGNRPLVIHHPGDHHLMVYVS